MAEIFNLSTKFFDIFRDWTSLSSQSAENAVEKILNNSGEYLADEQMKAVSNFHELYFAEADVSESKDAMNREVDDLIDAIQSQMDSGVPTNVPEKVIEDEDAKKTRLSLSGVQKSLETIITLEDGLREKLIPVLTSIQFEDVIKQRLSRLSMAWEVSIRSPLKDSNEIEKVGETIAERLGTSVERASFYPNVLKKQAPDEEVEEVTFLDSIITND